MSVVISKVYVFNSLIKLFKSKNKIVYNYYKTNVHIRSPGLNNNRTHREKLENIGKHHLRKIYWLMIGGNNWRGRYNVELCGMMEIASITSCVMGQRIQWFGHIMSRGEKKTARAALEKKFLSTRSKKR